MNHPQTTLRPAPFAGFIDALGKAMATWVPGDGPAARLAQEVGGVLRQNEGIWNGATSQQLPACRYLDPALTQARVAPEPVASLAAALESLAPLLCWRRRARSDGDDPAFHDGHANTSLVGPDGLELRTDVVVGISLMAPHTVYPLHQHPPREVYLVLSDGEWFNPDQGWYRPGIGGWVYHPANMLHAMRAGDDPLLALWCLRVGD